MHVEEANWKLQLRRPQEGVAEGQLKGSEGALEGPPNQAGNEAGHHPRLSLPAHQNLQLSL